MNESEKNFRIDVLKSQGWLGIESEARQQVEDLRSLATQPPAAITDTERTFYSGKAAGIEEFINTIKNSVDN